MQKKFMSCFLSILICVGFAVSVNTYATPKNSQNLWQEKWQQLEENEKNEIYELLQNRAESEIELLKKLAELEILDAKISEGIIQKLQEEIAHSREAGEFPGIFHHPPAPKEKRN